MLVYREDVFRYFLAVERARTERTGRPFVVTLLSLKGPDGGRTPFPPKVSAKVFGEMGLCIRESDFLGWFRDDMVAAAVLVAASSDKTAELKMAAASRIADRIQQRIASPIATQLTVRLLSVGRATSAVR